MIDEEALGVDEEPTGDGIDRTQLRAMLRLTPHQRLELLRDDVAGFDRLERARRS